MRDPVGRNRKASEVEPGWWILYISGEWRQVAGCQQGGPGYHCWVFADRGKSGYLGNDDVIRTLNPQEATAAGLKSHLTGECGCHHHGYGPADR